MTDTGSKSDCCTDCGNTGITVSKGEFCACDVGLYVSDVEDCVCVAEYYGVLVALSELGVEGEGFTLDMYCDFAEWDELDDSAAVECDDSLSESEEKK